MNSLRGCFFMFVLFCEAQRDEEQRGVPCSPRIKDQSRQGSAPQDLSDLTL